MIDQERIDKLRRAMQYGIENGKKNMIVDLDLLSELLSGRIPVGNNELPPEDVTALLYDVKKQRDDESWMHAACLTIAETGQKWGENVRPSLAMEAVYRMRMQNERYGAAARETLAVLAGCKEAIGNVPRIQHAIDLLTDALKQSEHAEAAP
jgi:hypothetical protein